MAARGRQALAPGRLVVAGVVVLVAAAYLWVDPGNPPGMFQDEAAIAVDANAIATTGRDQHDAFLPVYFNSLDDYKSPEYIYLLAAVFRVTGPSEQAARTLSALLTLAAALVIGLLAARRSGSAAVGVAALLVAAAVPWLFEVGRLVFEVALVPLALAALLLVVERAERESRWTTRSAVAVALALGSLTYAYTGTRAYAPVLAALLPLVCGLRRRFLAVVYATYGALLLPLATYVVRHPGALSGRFGETTFVTDGMSVPEIVRGFVENYARYWNLWAWVVDGDPIPRHHVPGTGSLSAAVVLLAVASVGLMLARRVPFGPFWRYVAAATALAPVGGALTDNEFHSLRAVPQMVCLVVLAIPALTVLQHALVARLRVGAALAVALALVWAFGVVDFAQAFREHGPGRRVDFHADVPALLARGLRERPRVVVEARDLVARDHVLWYLVGHPGGDDRLLVLPQGATEPAPEDLVFGSTDDCPFACVRVAEANGFWLARRA